MKLTKKQIKAIESLGWNVNHNTKDLISIYNESPSGEDMTTECNNVEDLISSCENFDPDEHFKVWYGVNRGEPSEPGELWKDCKAQEEMYSNLAKALKGEEIKEEIKLSKEDIEKLLIRTLHIELNNNGGSLEAIMSGMGLSEEEEKYIRDLMNWDDE